MIELKILIDEIDYDSVADFLVPLLVEKLKKEDKTGLFGSMLSGNSAMASNMARSLLKKMPQEKKDELVGQEDQSRFAYLRQMNALKLEMKKAVHQENFERAAELRDQIRSLEAAHKEQKENK